MCCPVAVGLALETFVAGCILRAAISSKTWGVVPFLEAKDVTPWGVLRLIGLAFQVCSSLGKTRDYPWFLEAKGTWSLLLTLKKWVHGPFILGNDRPDFKGQKETPGTSFWISMGKQKEAVGTLGLSKTATHLAVKDMPRIRIWACVVWRGNLCQVQQGNRKKTTTSWRSPYFDTDFGGPPILTLTQGGWQRQKGLGLNLPSHVRCDVYLKPSAIVSDHVGLCMSTYCQHVC